MTEARRWFAAAALAALSALAGCSGDDGGSNIGDGGNEQLPPPSLPDETIGREQAPALVTTPPSDTFLDGIVSDGAVTADELESAYRGYIDCMSAAGISGVYAWDVSLDIGVVVDGLTIDGDDPEGTRLRSAQADCARDYLGDLRRRYDEANPQHPADLRARPACQPRGVRRGGEPGDRRERARRHHHRHRGRRRVERRAATRSDADRRERRRPAPGRALPRLDGRSVPRVLMNEALVEEMRQVGVRRGDLVGLAIQDDRGCGLAAMPDGRIREWGLAIDDTVAAITAIERELRPRWVWWTGATAAALLRHGVRVARCWDVAAVHRLQFGGYRADPALVWAALQDTHPQASRCRRPELGPSAAGTSERDDPDDPDRGDGHLRPEWVASGRADSVARLGRWAAVALRAQQLQAARLATLAWDRPAIVSTVHSESAAELLAVELAHGGLPVDRRLAEEVITCAIRAVGRRRRCRRRET